MFKLLNCSYLNTWVLLFISNSSHHWEQEIGGGFRNIGVEWVLSSYHVISFWLSWKLYWHLQLIGCFLVNGAWWISLSGEQKKKKPTQSKDGSNTCDLDDLTVFSVNSQKLEYFSALQYKVNYMNLFFLLFLKTKAEPNKKTHTLQH